MPFGKGASFGNGGRKVIPAVVSPPRFGWRQKYNFYRALRSVVTDRSESRLCFAVFRMSTDELNRMMRNMLQVVVPKAVALGYLPPAALEEIRREKSPTQAPPSTPPSSRFPFYARRPYQS